MRNAECGMRNYLQEVRTYEGTSQLRNAEFGMRNGLKSKVQGARDGAGKVARRSGVGVRWTRAEPGCMIFLTWRSVVGARTFLEGEEKRIG